MALLGLLTISVIYWCLFTTLTTRRFDWIALCLWCVPVLAMTISYQAEMEINGFMVLLCILFFLLCRRSLLEVRMWNLKMRKKHSIIAGILYLFCLMVLYYCFWQAQALGYLWDFQGILLEKIDYTRLFFTSLPICLLAVPLANLLYNSLDRIYCKKEELVVLACKFFAADEYGGEQKIWIGYYLDGVHNGVNYHFRMTRGTFEMLNKEKTLKLQVRKGILGGLYVIENPCPENAKKTLKRDRRNLKIGLILYLLVLAGGIFLYGFYLTGRI